MDANPFCILLLASLIFCSGCHEPAATLEHEAVRVVVRDEAEMDALWEATLDVLRRHRFEIDRRDQQAGVITTFPETSGHYFEFWRRDTASRFDALEANLQTIRREVTVNITPADEPESRTLAVKVAKHRLSREDRQVGNTIAARRIFSSGIPTTTGEMLTREEAETWVDLGRDPRLEHRILDRVIAMYAPASFDYITEPAEPSLLPQANMPADP